MKDKKNYLREEKKDMGEDRFEKLDAVGKALSDKRKQAIVFRGGSDVEKVWEEDEDSYEGIDDTVKSSTDSSWAKKPPGMFESESGEPTRSSVFLNITRPYTDAASARTADMLLPTDERNFTLDITPVPDSLSDLSQGILRPEHEAMLAEKFPDPEQMAQAVAKASVEASKYIQDLKKKAKKAQTRLDDWLVECQFHLEIRKVIEDAAKVGVGVLKGPVPTKKKHTAYMMSEGKIVVKEETVPVSSRINYWNLYPDPSCGENIHDGSFIWEVDHISRKKLRELKGGKYIDEQIEACLEEGPKKALQSSERNGKQSEEDTDKFEIWYYHGSLDKDEMEVAGCECKEDIANAVVTMVNERVIMAAANPLDSGEFPYDVLRWQRKVGSWTGIGVARQIRTPQRMVNAAARNMMDNAGLASGGIIVMKQGAIIPADGVMALTPRKFFYVNETEIMEDVGKALRYIEIPMREKELLSIIQFALKMAEDVTGLPMILQGQQGKAPETVGGMTILNNNASGVLRRIAKMFDDYITEPHVRRYYAWLLQYGENEDEKGDFQVYAKASSALVERDLQNQAISQMGVMVTNPVFGISPSKWAKEMMKSQRLDPANFEFSDEEKQQMQEAQQKAQEAGPPEMMVAKMKADLQQKLLQMEQQFEATEAEKQRQFDLKLEEMSQRIEALKISGKLEINTESEKAMLAKTAISLRTQKELGAMAANKQPKPPTEPQGRAKPGQSFQA